jgi:hypothetical protein
MIIFPSNQYVIYNLLAVVIYAVMVISFDSFPGIYAVMIVSFDSFSFWMSNLH